jgi:hypothetical protein
LAYEYPPRPVKVCAAAGWQTDAANAGKSIIHTIRRDGRGDRVAERSGGSRTPGVGITRGLAETGCDGRSVPVFILFLAALRARWAARISGENHGAGGGR